MWDALEWNDHVDIVVHEQLSTRSTRRNDRRNVRIERNGDSALEIIMGVSVRDCCADGRRLRTL